MAWPKLMPLACSPCHTQPSLQLPGLPPFPCRAQALALLQQPPGGLVSYSAKLTAAISNRIEGLPDAALKQVGGGCMGRVQRRGGDQPK